MILKRVNSMGLTYHLMDKTPETTEIHCLNRDKRITVNRDLESLNQAWFHWMNGQYVQVAFSFLSPDEREFLMTGITGEEFDELFKDEGEDADDNRDGD